MSSDVRVNGENNETDSEARGFPNKCISYTAATLLTFLNVHVFRSIVPSSHGLVKGSTGGKENDAEFWSTAALQTGNSSARTLFALLKTPHLRKLTVIKHMKEAGGYVASGPPLRSLSVQP